MFGTTEQLVDLRPSDEALIIYLEDRIEYLRFARKPDSAERLAFLRAAVNRLAKEGEYDARNR